MEVKLVSDDDVKKQFIDERIYKDFFIFKADCNNSEKFHRVCDMMVELEGTFFSDGIHNDDFLVLMGIGFSYFFVKRTEKNRNRLEFLGEKYGLKIGFKGKIPKEKTRNPIGFALRHEVFKRDNYMCVECGTKENLEIEHKIPVSRGGTDELDNLRTMCKNCNLSKTNRVW